MLWQRSADARSGRLEAEDSAGGQRPRVARASVAVGIGFLALYLSSGAVVPGNDMRPSVFIPRAWLLQGTTTFAPADFPFMFRWSTLTPAGEARISPVDRAELELAARTAQVRLRGHKYYLAPTQTPGVYASIFGPVPGLLATPVVAVQALFDPERALSPVGLATSARFTAALMAAATVGIVFAMAALRTSMTHALLAALILGAGTSLWSTTSQGLLQHGPCTLFMTLAALCLWSPRPSTPRLVFAGLALGMAVCSRPSAVAVTALLVLYVAVRYRGRVLALIAGGAPLALALGAYNQTLFGAPWTSAQTLIDGQLMQASVGTTRLWSTPVLEGAAGLLLSPGRGLLVYSPIAAWAALGVWHARGEERWLLSALACGVLGMWGFAFKWFDWWGGWCFGYRPLVDAMPLLVLCMLPALERLRARSIQGLVFGAALAWSLATQALGAYAYEPLGWNAKAGRDVNVAAHRGRLWDWSDSPIVHYARHLEAARAERLRLARLWAQDPRI